MEVGWYAGVFNIEMCGIWSYWETDGQQKRAMEWNKHVSRREKFKVDGDTHLIVAQEKTNTDDSDHGCRVPKAPQERVVEW